jgi:hypothetical protein
MTAGGYSQRQKRYRTAVRGERSIWQPILFPSSGIGGKETESKFPMQNSLCTAKLHFSHCVFGKYTFHYKNFLSVDGEVTLSENEN